MSGTNVVQKTEEKKTNFYVCPMFVSYVLRYRGGHTNDSQHATSVTPQPTDPARQCGPQYRSLIIPRLHTHECFWFRKPESILQLQLDPGFSLNRAKCRLTE
jgi:hypothetical protein